MRASASGTTSPSRLQRFVIAGRPACPARRLGSSRRRCRIAAGPVAARLRSAMCGFISIFGPEGADVLQDVLSGLLAIQHRGQDAAGIVTFNDRFETKKGLGLVREVFEDKHLQRLRGHLAVGHVRYPTVGLGEKTDVQPFKIDYPLGVAMAHNGNVTNFHELKRSYFGERHVRLASNCDLEAVLYVFADRLMGRPNTTVTLDDVAAATRETFQRVKGAYSVVGIVAGVGMYAFRD